MWTRPREECVYGAENFLFEELCVGVMKTDAQLKALLRWHRVVVVVGTWGGASWDPSGKSCSDKNV